MQSSSVIDESPKTTSTESADAPAESPPEWSTFEARRRRTFIFLLFAAVYVGYHLIARWVNYPLFHGDWFFFGGERRMLTSGGDLRPPWVWPWYEPEFAYRWFMTVLPLA